MSNRGLPERITEARKAAGLKPVDLASKAGLSLGTIQNYEGGKTTPTLDGIYAIAAALDVDLIWLLEGDGFEEVA